MERETRTSPLSRVFLGIAIAGTIVSLAAILPWLSQYCLDAPRFVDELLGSPVSAFFAWNVVISARAVLVAASLVSGITRAQRNVVGVGTLLVGVSCGLPVLLFCWFRAGVVR